MSGWPGVLAAFLAAGLFPWLLGLLCLLPWWREAGGPRGIAVALAYPLGATLLSLAMLALGLAEVAISRVPVAVVAIVAAGLVGSAASRWLRFENTSPAPDTVENDPLRATWLVPAAAAVTLAHVGYVLFGIVRKPIEVWDAFAVWTLRAKTWADRHSLVLDPEDPFYLGGGARTDYPPHASLLHAWVAIALDKWNDVLVNLPWAFYYLSAVALAWAVVRYAVNQPWAWVAAAGLSGLPLFVAHANHPGYADSILAVHFLAVAAAIYLAARAGDGPEHRAWRALALAVVATLPLIKLEGVPLMVGGVLGAAVSGRRRSTANNRKWRWTMITLAVGVALVAAFSNQGLRAYVASTELHVEAVAPVLKSLFAGGSWHLLWIGFWALIVTRIRKLQGTPPGILGLTVLVPVLPFLYVLWFTDAWQYAANHTADSRLFLALAPAALLYVCVELAELWYLPVARRWRS